jgi:hypothetical protein
MCIETINSCLTYALRRNQRLLYELLYKRSVIGNLRKLCVLPQLVNNIEIVMQFFAQQLHMAEGKYANLEGIQTPRDEDLDTLDTPKFNEEAEDKFFSRKRGISFDEDIDIEDSQYVDYSHGSKTWTVEEVMEILEKGVKIWNSTSKDTKFKSFKHLPFTYTEDANTEA